MSPRIGGIAAAASAAAAGALLLIETPKGHIRKSPIAGEVPAGEVIAVLAIGFNGNDEGVKY